MTKSIEWISGGRGTKAAGGEERRLQGCARVTRSKSAMIVILSRPLEPGYCRHRSVRWDTHDRDPLKSPPTFGTTMPSLSQPPLSNPTSIPSLNASIQYCRTKARVQFYQFSNNGCTAPQHTIRLTLRIHRQTRFPTEWTRIAD